MRLLDFLVALHYGQLEAIPNCFGFGVGTLNDLITLFLSLLNNLDRLFLRRLQSRYGLLLRQRGPFHDIRNMSELFEFCDLVINRFSTFAA